jgi:uroporphyrinogen-III decarboxylase
MTTSRERLVQTLNHQEPDRVPIDLGSSTVSGIAASTLAKLRSELHLERKPVRIIEPFQVLGEVEEDVREILGIDVVGIWPLKAMFFGYDQEDWKPWKLQDGTTVSIGSGFNWTQDGEGNIYTYPCGDTTARPCAKMPRGGYYFDSISDNRAIRENELDARDDFKDQFKPYSEDELRYFEEKAVSLHDNTSYGITINFWQSSIGDVGFLPGGSVKNPKGIRDIETFLASFLLRPHYIKELFEMQVDVAIENLKLLNQAIGSKANAIFVSGVDLGTQRGPLISLDMYREFYKAHHKRLNEWIHTHTPWKTIFHSCGSVVSFLDEFVEVGVDVLNPVQTSAIGMDPNVLKEKYGKKLVFWGGGIDTQQILPFGTAEEVRRDTLEKLSILSKGGGFVFNTIHNIQHNVPVKNILSMFDAIREFSGMPGILNEQH